MQIQKSAANCENDNRNVSRGPKKVMNQAIVQCLAQAYISCHLIGHVVIYS